MERLERLVNLVAALIDTNHPLTRAEIAERIDGYSSDPHAFRRNFERDKDLLRQMGFPVVTETPDGANEEVGYRIPRELYELADPGLDEEELTAIRLAASAVHLEGEWSESLQAALRKLGGAVGPSRVSSRGEVAQVAGAEVHVEATAAVAFAAIAERRRVAFAYSGRQRLVDPWRLSYHRGHWYLAGFDSGPAEERLFRLDRVESELVALGDSGAFDAPSEARAGPPPPWRIGDETQKLATVLVDADHAVLARTEFGEAAVKEVRDDGSTLFQIAVTSTAGLRSVVLGYLDHAEIVGPAELRDDVISWLEALA